ncbi:winged helix-turn-helix transcriptional regulator [Bradyrhizobium tropiciagri]|uniref:MarR family winged helix-turn-helix transcriptional regulator n=1 Tax=Bradyrhizobium tropiciagri TaxID=312253 RepID=UPI001BAD55ED|nr:MarR family winged helix-turn-helix transcriptional regulator [Bradyrhizobium tropiciagri]MBR0898909.1 winged helix-turn-helix transcriptional regulator [Bradyrhizobium tropiciagri]
MRGKIVSEAAERRREPSLFDRHKTETAKPELSWMGLRLSVVSNLFSAAYYAELLFRYELLRDEAASIVYVACRECRTSQDIVRHTGRPKNTVARAVRNLEQRGFVVRSEDLHDSRASRIKLTERGRDMFRKIERVAVRHDLLAFDGLTGQEQETLARLLDKLTRTLLGSQNDG